MLHGYQIGGEIYLLTVDKGLGAPLLQQLARPNTVNLGRRWLIEIFCCTWNHTASTMILCLHSGYLRAWSWPSYSGGRPWEVQSKKELKKGWSTSVASKQQIL